MRRLDHVVDTAILSAWVDQTRSSGNATRVVYRSGPEQKDRGGVLSILVLEIGGRN